LWLALFSVITEAKTKVTSQPFGKMPDGTPAEIFTLSDAPFEARIATYGGIVVSLAKAGRTGGDDTVATETNRGYELSARDFSFLSHIL
jgi:hypothetical protein